MRSIFSVLDLSAAEFTGLIDEAIAAQGKPLSRSLEGRNVGIWFSRPSTRTRSAFTLAAGGLGAAVVNYQPGEMQLVTGETVGDTALVLGQYLDVLVMRGRSFQELQPYADAGVSLVINALTDEEHPSQALADFMTLKQCFGGFEGLSFLYLGDGGNIATSLLYAGARMPAMTIHFATPAAYDFPDPVIETARQLAGESGARIEFHHDPAQLPGNMDAVYTTRWRSMGEEKDDPEWRRHFEGFQLNEALLRRVGNDRTVVMHDLPAERGSEVDDATLDGVRSVVARQARNKLETAYALLRLAAN